MDKKVILKVVLYICMHCITYCNEGLNDFKIIQLFFHSFLHTQKEELKKSKKYGV